MKPYQVFGGDNYYPQGGMWDLIGDAEDLDGARAIACGLDDFGNHYQWSHIALITDIVESFISGKPLRD